MAENGNLPALRPLDVTAFRASNNELYFSMHDLSQIAPQPIAISLPGYFVVALLDGSHSCGEIQSAFEKEFGRPIEAAEIERVVEALDKALLLNSDRLEQAYANKRDTYRAADARDNRQRWPDADALRSEIDAMLAGGNAADVTSIAGFAAPHLDYARGGPCYADSYATLRAAGISDIERFVILGTNHFGRSAAVVATGKDFVTPLGRVKTDRSFIETIESRLGESIRTHEFDHQAEHSIELHVHILQVCSPDQSFEIVPVLCPDPSGPTGTRPLDGEGPDLGEFADVLRDLLAKTDRNTMVIASADLSHVGQRFGEDERTDKAFMSRIAQSDRSLLSLLERRQEQQFVEAVAATQNQTRICSVGCLYTMLRALPGRACRLLRYHQAVDFENEMHVTCASAVVE